jgi:hypothetical protein
LGDLRKATAFLSQAGACAKDTMVESLFLTAWRMRRAHSGGVSFYPRLVHAQRTQLWILFLSQAGACVEDTVVESLFIPGWRIRRAHSGGVSFYLALAHAQRTQW